MKKYNNLFKCSLLAIVLTFSNCETIDLDQTENPSQISEDLLDPVYTFNYVQIQLADFVETANSFTQRVTRQMAMTGGNSYNNAFQPVNFNANWNTGYNILNAIKVMEPKAIEKKESYALGGAKVIRVYVLMTMVDMYGNIPYSEALQGGANLNPKFDNSADIYRGLLTELDAAIVLLNQSNAAGSKVQDLYYDKKEKWITLANTLKLKMYCTARLAGSQFGVNDINAAIQTVVSAEGGIIDDESEDFAFKYGDSRFVPNTRHPLYNDQYENNGGAYIANYMMWAMTTEKKFSSQISTSPSRIDPRTSFYFYRQDENPNDEDNFTLPIVARPEEYNDIKYRSFYTFVPTLGEPALTPFIVSNWVGELNAPANGFWGRDHGDNAGIPPDASKRTVGGQYPIGGEYGAFGDVQTGGDKGAKGAGITPIIMSSFVHFMLAEAIQTGASIGGMTAAGEFENGMRASIKKVVNFLPDFVYSGGESQPSAAVLLAQENAYVTWMLGFFNDSSANSNYKVELIVKELYIASWGNGIEPYNAYRRTGFPSNFQPTREPAAGDFFSTALYPANSVVNNPNAPVNVRTKKVFWDVAGLTLH